MPYGATVLKHDHLGKINAHEIFWGTSIHCMSSGLVEGIGINNNYCIKRFFVMFRINRVSYMYYQKETVQNVLHLSAAS